MDLDLKDAVTSALKKVEDPCSVALNAGVSVHDLGLLVDTYVKDGGLVVELTLTDPLCPLFETLEAMVVDAVSKETGFESVTVDISSNVAWSPDRLNKGRPGSPMSVRAPVLRRRAAAASLAPRRGNE